MSAPQDSEGKRRYEEMKAVRTRRQGAQETPARRWWRYLGLAWKSVSTFSAVAATALLSNPKLSVSVGANLDPTTAYGSIFTVKNEGFWPVFSATFNCLFDDKQPFSNVRMAGFSGIAQALWPGQSMTRGCGTAGSGLRANARVSVSVLYDWPLPFAWLRFQRQTQPALFTGRESKSGFLLVPDIGDPEPAPAIRFQERGAF
jgi:hypothetical protein